MRFGVGRRGAGAISVCVCVCDVRVDYTTDEHIIDKSMSDDDMRHHTAHRHRDRIVVCRVLSIRNSSARNVKINTEIYAQ